MGLSNEERIKRVLNSIVGMRKNFDPADTRMWENRDDRHIEPHIAAVKESLDQLAGLLIQHTDTNGFFWFMGESDDGFRGLTMLYFQAEEQSISHACLDEALHGESDNALTLHQFAFRAGFSAHRNMVNLAHWWDMWCYIPSLLYGMNRYEDDLFKPEFRQEVNRLIALMQQFRLQLLGKRSHTEQVMLLKYKLYADASSADERSWTIRCDELRAMTQEELEEEINKREREQHKHSDDYHREERKKQKARGFIDPLYGKVEMTVDGLVKDVRAVLHDMQPFHYVERRDILRALDLYKASPEDVALGLHKFEEQKLAHRRRYGEENVKICDDCELVVLDQRNKTGMCRACLTLENIRKKRSKK